MTADVEMARLSDVWTNLDKIRGPKNGCASNMEGDSGRQFQQRNAGHTLQGDKLDRDKRQASDSIYCPFQSIGWEILTLAQKFDAGSAK